MEPEIRDPHEPLGMAGAAAQVQSEASAAADDAAGMEAGAQPQEQAPVDIPWEGVVELCVRVVFGRLEQRDPEVWTLQAEERAALVKAWSRYLETVAMAPGPFTGALIVTSAVVGPRLAMMRRRQIEERMAEEDGRSAA